MLGEYTGRNTKIYLLTWYLLRYISYIELCRFLTCLDQTCDEWRLRLDLKITLLTENYHNEISDKPIKLKTCKGYLLRSLYADGISMYSFFMMNLFRYIITR